MRALIMPAVVALLLVCGQDCRACINDSRTAPLEREYRDQYTPEPEYQPSPPPEAASNSPVILAGIGGVTMLLTLGYLLVDPK